MKLRSILPLLTLAALAQAADAPLEPKPPGEAFADLAPVQAPAPGPLLLRKGDRLAICGDSITQQQKYSRILETYLTVCTPELELTARQYGWSGEQAAGFLKRMQNDCLRFGPTVATTCYGMNDFHYVPYTDEIGTAYRQNMTGVVEAFKQGGARVVLGSPGPIAKFPTWVKSASGTNKEHNLSLCTLRNIDIEIARKEDVRFADIFWPMYTLLAATHEKYGAAYDLAGHDGVHPGWAGHVVMASAFLKSLGVTGDIGTITLNLETGAATATAGHEVQGHSPGEVTLISRKYPFCAEEKLESDDSLRSGMDLVHFDEHFNRLLLKVEKATAPEYTVTWGEQKKVFPGKALAAGINLATEFEANPFSEPFKKVDQAVAAKQAFEQKEMQKDMHGAEAKADMEGVVKRDEVQHAVLAEALKAAFQPVTHRITVVAVK
jgi:lysophospholipase L1-like esterase